MITGRTITPGRGARARHPQPAVPRRRDCRADARVRGDARRRARRRRSARSSSPSTRASTSLDDGLARERELIEQLFRTADGREGLAAFAEKRKPVFSGGVMATTLETDVTVVRNPATGEEVGPRPAVGRPREDAEAVARGRSEAFPAWWRAPAAKRGAICARGRRGRARARDELALQLTLEQGKPLREARIEITRFVHTLEHYAGLAKSLRGAYVPNLDENAHGLVLKRPLGVVVAIVPVELPDDAARQQARAGARLRQHARREAGGDDAADDAPDRRDHARGGPARRASSRSSPARARCSARRSSPTRASPRSRSPARRRSESTSPSSPRAASSA